jgi:hypothetical protein
MPSYRFMRGRGVFTAEEQEWIEDWFCALIPYMSFPLQRANFGRYAGLAETLKDTRRAGAADDLLAPAPHPFASPRLGGNDSFAYDRIDWKHQMIMAEALKPDALRGDQFRQVSEAYFSLWTPTGIQPGYGDDTGSSLWDPILPEWMAAHALQNGQYKAIAIRALQFALDHDQLRELGAQPALFTLWSHADDRIEPTAPTLPSRIVPLGGERDKLILRRGWQPDDLYLLCDLWGGSGHNHDDQGAVNWLIWLGKVWMADTNYGVRASANHNLLWIEGTAAGSRVRRATLSAADDGPLTISTAALVSDDYGIAGTRWTRQIAHATRNGQGPETDRLTITDTLTTDTALAAPVRLLWHVRGKPTAISATAWRFEQEDVALTLTVTGGQVDVKAYEEPKQLDVGTGCPPEAYQLCWGAPYSRVTVTPEKHALQPGESVRFVTEITITQRPP